MARHENTLDEIVKRVCQVHLRDWAEGIASAGAAATLTDTIRRNERTDYWNNLPYAEIYIRTTTDGADPQGDVRAISDFAAGVITASDNFSAAPDANDTYSIHTQYRRLDVVEAINAAIDRATDEGCLIDIIDETILVVDDVFEYPLPSGFTHVYKITMSDEDLDFDVMMPVPPSHYRIIRGMDNPRLKFLTMPDTALPQDHYYGALWANDSLTADRILRIEGFGKQPELVENTDICYLSPNFICPQAAAILHSARIRRNDVDPDEHATQFGVQQAMADKALRTAKPQFPPDIKRVVL